MSLIIGERTPSCELKFPLIDTAISQALSIPANWTVTEKRLVMDHYFDAETLQDRMDRFVRLQAQLSRALDHPLSQAECVSLLSEYLQSTEVAVLGLIVSAVDIED